MQDLEKIDSLISEIFTIFPIPENSSVQVEKKRLEILLKLKDWQIEAHNFFKEPGMKQTKKVAGFIQQNSGDGNTNIQGSLIIKK